MQGPDALLNIVTIPPGATQTQARLVLDGVRGAIFLYANGGPVGTLVGSWAISAGTDPYGNAYPQGFSVNVGSITGGTISGVTITGSTITGTVFQGTDFVLNSSGLFFYSGTPALGNLIVSVTPNSGVDGHGNAYAQGLTAYNIVSGVEFIINMNTLGPSNLLGMTITTLGSGAPAIGGGIYGNVSSSANEVLITSGQSNAGSVQATIELIDQFVSGITNGEISISAGFISLGNGPTLQIDDNHLTTTLTNAPAAPSPPSVGPALFGLNGTLTTERPSGLSGQLAITQTDTSVNTNANNAGATRITAIWSVPANDAQAGTLYEIEVPFSCTMESQTLELGLSIDGSTSFSVADTIGGAIVAAGIGLRGWVTVILRVATAGSSGLADAFMAGGVRQSGANALFTNGAALAGNPTTGIAFNTTVAHTLRVNSLWGATAAGQTVSGFGSTFTRKGP